MKNGIGACVSVVVLLVDGVVVVLVDVVVELVVVDVVVELVVLLVVELVVVEVVLLVVELVVVEVVLLVVELVVVVAPTGQVGRPASPVQVQRNALHWSVTFFAQVIEGGDPHAAAISSLQALFLSHLPNWGLSAVAEDERKTPTANVTVANKRAALLVVPVIAESPVAVSRSPYPYPSPHDPYTTAR